MERNTQKNGLINLLVLLVAGVSAFAVARYSHTLAGQVSVLYLGIGLLVTAVGWFQMRLEEGERLEKLELEEIVKGRSTSALFEGKESDVLPAQRSREQFERYFLPVFTVLVCLTQAGGAWYLWTWLSKPATPKPLVQPMTAMFLFLLLGLLLFILGRFSSTYARLENNRLLRPGASYLLLNAILCSAVGLGIIGVQVGFPRTDFYLAYALCLVLAIVSIETLVTLILEVYRPRVRGKVERPLYESRLVGLLGQPEGLITTAAQAIDYQFGFKVSETWFYRFFERAILWLLPLQLALLLASTMFVVIEPGEQGLLERFGRPVANRMVLDPGLHVTWPWPVDKVYRQGTEQIQSFTIGVAPEEKHEKEKIVLWTVAHNKEENFLVANRVQDNSGITNSTTGKRTPPVSLITVSIPVQFQITNVSSWVYNNDDSAALLQDVATREVVRYLAGVDMNEVMGSGRQQASDTLVRLIQEASQERVLGARIISVGLQDLHPPVKVAPDYEKVIGAVQTREAKVLAAQADQIRTNALAESAAVTLINRAEADRTSRQIGALAQASLFTNQIPAFKAAPSVYAQRAYLQAFARATATARKYIMLTTNTHEVYQFDLQDKIREDLLNIKVPSPNAK